MSDLREALEEVAGELRDAVGTASSSSAADEWEEGFLAGKHEAYARAHVLVDDLLASHEEREWETCPNGFPESTLLRSHTDREPDGWLVEWRFALGASQHRPWTRGGWLHADIQGAEREAEQRTNYETRIRPVYIGTPVQPEEEEDAD